MNAALIARAGNDADIVEAFVRHHAALVDLLVVIDTGSRDGTRAILEALRREGLPLLIVDDPEAGAPRAARLTRTLRMVLPVFSPELVWLLDVGDFVRGDRAAIEGELGRLPPGTTAVLPRWLYAPDAVAAACPALPDPLAAITRRHAAAVTGEFHGVLRRDPADDATLVVDEIGAPLRRGEEALAAFAADRAAIASLPLRGAAQLTVGLLHAWQGHRARHVGDSGARATFPARALLDQVLAGRPLTPADVVQAVCGAVPESALVHDPVAHAGETLRYLDLVDHAALAAVANGERWPQDTFAPSTVATGTAMDLAPILDLRNSLQAERAIVMAPPAWGQAVAEACPGLALHVPQEGAPDVAVDLLLLPGMPTGFATELAEVARPELIRRIAVWPAEPRAEGALAAELACWQAGGWEPDMMRTLAFRALSTYAAGRRGALVLGPVDPARAARADAVRQALVDLESRPTAWIDPPASLILHPLQSIGLKAPPAPALPVPAAATAAPVTPTPRSVLILGAGRSGTSCLAGMFGPPSHHHAGELYAPQVSNPKGFFEAGHINDLNESMLLMSAVAHLGADGARALLQGFEPHQLWLARFPDAMPAAWNDVHRRQVAKAVAQAPFVIKDPRMAVTAPAWLEAAPDALLLSIHRAPDITAESILKECRVATYLLDFRISMKDAFDVWRQAYRRAVKLYRAGADVLFLRYDDLFDADRLARLEARVRAPLRREFAERHLNRTAPFLKVPEECAALARLLDELAVLSFEDRRAQAEAAIDRHLAQWPDRPLAPALAAIAAA
jgi:hypothetical protein